MVFRLGMLAMDRLLPRSLMVARIRGIIIIGIYCRSALHGRVCVVGDLATLLRLMLARGLSRAATWQLLLAARVNHIRRALLLQFNEFGLERLNSMVFLSYRIRLNLDLIESFLLGM